MSKREMKKTLSGEGMRERRTRTPEKPEFRISFAAISRRSRERRVHSELQVHLDRYALLHPPFIHLLTVVGRVIVTAIPFSCPNV
jgi:hypothetical protein